jgi:hypothetical protein
LTVEHTAWSGDEPQETLLAKSGCGGELFLSPEPTSATYGRSHEARTSRAELVRMQLDGERHAGAAQVAKPNRRSPPDANPVTSW